MRTSRRRESVRRRREERRHRDPVEAGVAPAPPARPARDIAWMGLLGGVFGVSLLAQSALFNLVSDDGTTVGGIALAALACLYLPAIWASVAATPHRRRVLRGVLGVTLAIVVLGVLFIDASFATLLLIPSTLLAIASGLVWQGARTP